MIRVASFNIRNGRAIDGRNSWPFRAGRVRTRVSGLDADIVGLQEVYRFQLRSIERSMEAYDHVAGGRNRGGGGEGAPVWWRLERFRGEQSCIRWYSLTPEVAGSRWESARQPRIATICELTERATGRRLTVANTHLDAQEPSCRLRSVELLVEWLEGRPAPIVLGDLNESPDGPAVGHLLDAGYRDALDETTTGTAHQFTGRRDGERIDHILVGDAYRVVGARIHDTDEPCSDHFPVSADLEPVTPSP